MITEIAEIKRRLSALERAVNALVQVGRVVAVQRTPYRVQVDVGTPDQPVVTGWIPAQVLRAGQAIVYSLLSVGERCLLVSPGGDAAGGVSLNTHKHPAPGGLTGEPVTL